MAYNSFKHNGKQVAKIIKILLPPRIKHGDKIKEKKGAKMTRITEANNLQFNRIFIHR